MNVSAINSINTNFKGTDDFIDVPSYTIRDKGSKLDRVDFKSIADTIDNGHDVRRATSPIRFFLITTALAAASFVGFRAASLGTMNTINSKLGLSNAAGKYLGSKVAHFMKHYPQMEGKTVKAFVVNGSRDAIAKVMKYGAKGANLAEIDAAKGVTKSAIYAKNALHKAISGVVGASAAGLTVASRYSDADGNGIPDKAERVLSTAKEVMEIVPALASAVSLS